MNVLCSSTKRRKPRTEPAVKPEVQKIFDGDTVIYRGLRAIARDVDWPARRVDLSFLRAGESQPCPKYRVPISDVEIVPVKTFVFVPGTGLQSW